MRSGKPTFVDKTFAPNAAAAERIFNLAAKHKTPVWSSSALRFVDALTEFFATGNPPVAARETIDLRGMLETGRKALRQPFIWVDI